MNRIERIRVALASPDQIRSWSGGEVRSAETFNYRTKKPVPGGLFCEGIFGTTESFRCRCGAYSGHHFQGLLCPTCSTHVGHVRERRERMGHLELAEPVVHTWFVRSSPSPIAVLLGLTRRHVEALVQCAAWAVVGCQLQGPLAPRVGQVVDDDTRDQWAGQFGPAVTFGTGASALQTLLAAIDLQQLLGQLRRTEACSGMSARKALRRRIALVNDLRQSGVRPEWMVLTVLPVLPPELRPIIELDGGREAVSDLNELYRRVIHRNLRLWRMKQLAAVPAILRNEHRLLQQAVDALLDNAALARPATTSSGNHVLRSLTDALSGKRGRFRQNLLGKRVDFSGRSVIAVDPDLRPWQCGLPLRMAVELFKPFLVRRVMRGDSEVETPEAAQKWMAAPANRGALMDTISAEFREQVVLLNRAPTLHRLGIQAFAPVLVSGDAIRLHPLYCTAFNADFDGDQMAVHVPLTPTARTEAWELMLGTRNALLPADGSPVVAPTKDMVFGCYYLTSLKRDAPGTGQLFGSMREAILAHELGRVDLQAQVRLRLTADEAEVGKVAFDDRFLTTTVGRIIFNEALPYSLRFDPALDYPVDKGVLKRLMARCCAASGLDHWLVVADRLMHLGFHYATRAGGSIAMSDLHTPEGKAEILADADHQVEQVERERQRGLLSDDETYNLRVQAWSEATERVTGLVAGELDDESMVGMFARSGAAKGEMNQIRQLVGMRGLMADASNRIVDLPIRSNFREGLSVLEYFVSTRGARKGMADTALRTSKAGYLTRRLINAAQDAVISIEDCSAGGPIPGLRLELRELGAEQLVSSAVGRHLARALWDEEGVPIAHANTEISEGLVRAALAAGLTAVWVRSPITCRARQGLCAMCYGQHLATARLAQPGDAVGIMAAQSIGEPGTQLTMRTFHTGGVAGSDITSGLPRVIALLEGRSEGPRALLAPLTGVLQLAPGGNRARLVGMDREACRLPPGLEPLVRVGERVRAGQVVLARNGWRGQSGSDWPCITAQRSGRVLAILPDLLLVGCENGERRDLTLPSGVRWIVADGDFVEGGDVLTDGSVYPGDLVGIGGLQAAQWRLVREVQAVYRGQGASIHDKHVEVIVREMGRALTVTAAGDTRLHEGELVDRWDFEDENSRVLAQGGTPAMAAAMVLGITRVALRHRSFLAAAAFQNTSRVLGMAALRGEEDRLQGLNENIIVGNLAPCGTGWRNEQGATSHHRTQGADMSERLLTDSTAGAAVTNEGLNVSRDRSETRPVVAPGSFGAVTR